MEALGREVSSTLADSEACHEDAFSLQSFVRSYAYECAYHVAHWVVVCHGLHVGDVVGEREVRVLL
jgi:hypothetical protein